MKLIQYSNETFPSIFSRLRNTKPRMLRSTDLRRELKIKPKLLTLDGVKENVNQSGGSSLRSSMGRNKLVMKKIEDSTSRQRTYSKHKDSLVKKANELAILCDTDVALLMFSPTGEVTRYSSRGRCYEPQVENISSVQEADAYQEFLLSAMEQIRSQARLLGGEGYLQINENVGVKWLRSTQRLPLLQVMDLHIQSEEPVGDTSCEEIDWIATDRALASGVEQL
ncbi:hypothetical protein CQW23_17155 [Capsicum baccatum]|uniref:MADS-box domain-containing protein n=1 Tax=Capsicum baccatum TaxID=33114 RepID=A0A2G2WDE4_CAPBA|nr:hypothetical protein CQW23_17155 [Capsicum baccatum]